MQGAVIQAIVMGIVATLATDVWLRLLQAIVGFPLANWALVGRWVAGFPWGVFVHSPIAAPAKVRGELAIGWVFHYAVGIVFASLYLTIMKLTFGSPPTLFSALLFGIVTLIAPWFVMQPALGLGFMAARRPKSGAVRAINVSVHAVFGFGLYLGTVAARLASVV